jgi:signal transduction histidine kinase
VIEERHILIIDDNEEDRMVLRRILRRVNEFKYTFTEVGLGEQGLAICYATPPSCVLLDYSLPDMSGIDVLQELRQSETALRFVPVIILTGQGSEDIAVQAIKGGAQDYIKKYDYTIERISTSIDNAIEHMRLKAALYALEQQRAELYELEKQARAQAEDANRTKIRFMGMISHEMGGPLASMKMLAESMMSNKATLEKAQQVLRIIKDEADRLYDLVSQLLDLSRMQSSSLILQRDSNQLRDVLASVQLQLGTMAPDHHLVFDLPSDLPPVWIDPRRIKQVIFNLVSNAAKFSPPQTPITLRAFVRDKVVQVEVSDQGIGIPADKHTFVFEPFQQLEGLNQAKGTGLGLAVCKGIIEAHGGEMWIARDTPLGATLCFTLPIAEDAEQLETSS